ncbi:hypothetical protein [Candidatus Chlorohelix sp.]|uniref:hypothetical protein n=1 Tax=Candidatus Chlorohelix sp. TaxID=3139201 RepID=UPI00301F6EE7
MKTDKHIQELFENRVDYLQQGKSLEPDIVITFEQEMALENMLELVVQSRQAPSFALNAEKRQMLTADLKARLQAKSRLTIVPPLPGNILALEPRRTVTNNQPRRLNRLHGLQLVMVAASVVLALGLLIGLALSEQPGNNNIAAPNTSIPAATFETTNIEITTTAPETAVTEDATATVETTQQTTSVSTTTNLSTTVVQLTTLAPRTTQAPANMQTTTQAPVVATNPSATTESEKQTLIATVAPTTTTTPAIAKTVTTVVTTIKTPNTTPNATPTPTSNHEDNHEDEKKSNMTPTPSATHDNNEESDKNKDSKD